MARLLKAMLPALLQAADDGDAAAIDDLLLSGANVNAATSVRRARPHPRILLQGPTQRVVRGRALLRLACTRGCGTSDAR
jgi:hypothetical protein